MPARSEDLRRTRDILDLQDGTGPVPTLDGPGIQAALRPAGGSRSSARHPIRGAQARA